MYRCITELRGIVFDIDGFSDAELTKIASEFADYKVLCMTFTDSAISRLRTCFTAGQIYKLESFQRFFAPNRTTHSETLRRLGIKATELLYVSKRLDFLRNAMGFMGGTAWVTKTVDYKKVSTAPDLICGSLKELSSYIHNRVNGFFGEVVVFPGRQEKRGVLIPVDFQSDKGVVPLYMLGRYFGDSQYMNQLHPYSSAIYLNKKAGKAYGTYNNTFQNLLVKTVQCIQDECHIDGICAVPPRPGYINRFSDMLKAVAGKTQIEDYGPDLICIRDYPSQKGLTYQERKENIKGVFSFEENITGKNVIIMDDIATTGSTLNECINVLFEAGAAKVFAVVFAINQQGREYWSSNTIQVSCPNCGAKMILLINSYNKKFFYSCPECRRTSMDFEDGRKTIELLVNEEFKEENAESDLKNWE